METGKSYLTPEQAREKWSRDNDLPLHMAPDYPEGTREYDVYREALTEQLDRFANGEK